MPKRIPTGRVFQKTYPDRRGRNRRTATFYLKYYVRGKAIELSSGTTDYDEAMATLRQKMAEAARQGEHTDHPERVRMNQLFDLLVDDYRYKNRKSTYDTELRVNRHLRPFFGDIKAQVIGTSKLREYVAHRRRQKDEPATINKELSFVRRAMKLGAQHDPPLVFRVPHFEMLPVDNAREGVLEHEAYAAVRDALPPYARIALVIGYHTGARKGEIRSIRKDKINFNAGRIDLPGRTTKNGKPRYLPIYGDMKAELDMALAATAKSKCPLLIQHNEKPVYDRGRAKRERSHGNYGPQDPRGVRPLPHRERTPNETKRAEARRAPKSQGDCGRRGARRRGKSKTPRPLSPVESW